MNKIQLYTLSAALLAVCGLVSGASMAMEDLRTRSTEPIEVIQITAADNFTIIDIDAPYRLFDIRPAVIRSSPGFTYPRILLTSAGAGRQPPIKANGRPDPLLRWRSRYIA